jgi:hypothetical protein
MTDTLYASGSFDFEGGSFATEYVAYVLGTVKDTDPTVLEFTSGTAKIYDLGPARIFGMGTSAWNGGSAKIYTLVPFGGFEDFAIYPETSSDPLNGFVVADQAGNSAGVGQPWTRHYLVAVPPRGARFAVPHIKLGALAANTSQYLDAHQLEVLRRDQTAPTAFGSARSIIPTVRPARLNYATGSTTVTSLTPGRVYTASATVNGKRESYQFTPTSSTWHLTFSGTPTKILVEEGTLLGDYFDGNSGPDYLWEQGGTPGSTRSYYYPDRELRHSVLVRTLAENVALGITVEDPVYAVLPSPSTTA